MRNPKPDSNRRPVSVRMAPSAGKLDLNKYRILRIEQRVEKLEFFTGIEGANRYDVVAGGRDIIAHASESTSAVHRIAFGGSRLETIELHDSSGALVAKLSESFGFPFSTHNVTDHAGRPLFRIKQRFALRHREYVVSGEGTADLLMKGPWWRPWTFWIYQDENLVGKITKRYSGTGRELGTDADMFDVEFLGITADEQQRLRVLVLGFVVDMKYFEDSSRSGSLIGHGI